MIRIRQIGFICIAVILTACSQRALHEALHVVAQADSLWTAGKAYDDNVSLAQAYNELGRHRSSCPDEYVHACYHYGKLLRTKDDPVGAMQAFINATHTGSHDFHILGRVYSNMGDICHYAGEFTLSYDMFERSADMFLKNGDTLLYYYDLNNMAFELAEQGDSIQTMELLNTIRAYSNSGIRIKTLETEACLHQTLCQHGKVIMFVDSLQHYGYSEALGYMMKARAFNYLDMPDSALIYANKVVSIAPDENVSIAAYYILTHDKTLSTDSLLVLSSLRADVQKAWAYSHSKLSQATQLLEQDLARKPDWTWLYAVLITLAVIGIGALCYIQSKRRKKGLLTQEIDVLEQAASNMQEKHEELTQRLVSNHRRIEEEINNRCAMLQTKDKIIKILAWKNYSKMCTIVDKQFYMMASKLCQRSLNETEVRLCVLTLLDCGYDRMAELLYVSDTSVGTLKRRAAKKLKTTSKDLRSYLIDNVCIK